MEKTLIHPAAGWKGEAHILIPEATRNYLYSSVPFQDVLLGCCRGFCALHGLANVL